MAVALLPRSHSADSLPVMPADDRDVEQLRESAKKVGEAVTHTACGLTQAGVGIGLTAGGLPHVAMPVGMGLQVAEGITVVGSKQITDSGFVDGAIQHTHGFTNSCMIL